MPILKSSSSSSEPLEAGREGAAAGASYAPELPGQFPYTRGIHPQMYRTRLWTMRQVAGFATGEDTNQRFRFLTQQGQTGLSVTFDMPTLMGYDSDDPISRGEVGRGGVAVSSLEDMEALFHGIPLDKSTVSMTINGPAAVVWAMYLATAERQGADWKRLSGTLQNDILKEYIAQKEYIYPPGPSMRLVTDTIEYGAQHVPQFNPISISGYHIREAGSTAVQEIALTLRGGMEYVEWAMRRGLAVDAFAPRLSFFFNAHSNLLEEVAKFRAARRIWAKAMRERYGAQEERSCKLRFHAQTAGSSLTLQQPYNNVVRTTVQALAAVLGGCQSLHTNSLDEAIALPTEAAVTLALRTQHVLAHESGVADVPDPFGGSFYLEAMTTQLEEAANAYIERIDAMGGMLPAIEQGYPQREIAQAAYAYQCGVERGESKVVGVNIFNDAAESTVEPFQVDEDAERRQVERLRALRLRRNQNEVQRTLAGVKRAAGIEENMMPTILDAVRAHATVGEISNTMAEVFGRYTEVPIL